MTTEILLIGDSHTDALATGCDRLGIKYHSVRSSGAAWFMGKYGFHPTKGLVAQPGPPRKKLRLLLEDMGQENIFDAGLPVIASFGFNLGKVLSALSWHNHSVVDEDGSYENDGKVAMSRGFAREYVEANCGKNFRIIKNMAKVATVTMVVPPRVDASHNRLQCVDLIRERMIEVGADVFDPSHPLTKSPTKPVAKKLLLDDGVHGGPEYGEAAIQAMIDAGVFERAKKVA